jgi:signal transduction histidine kinase/ligand-binding sensor domain-containing protein
MRSWLFLTGLLILSAKLYSKQEADLPAIRQLTTQQGLADNRVKFFYQDHSGLIWLNTRNGLQRYDGTRFFTLSYDPQDPQGSLPSSIMNFGITEDVKQNIWAVTEHEGPVRFTPGSGELLSFTRQLKQKEYRRSHTIVHTSRKTILMSTGGGLLKWTPAGFKLLEDQRKRLPISDFNNLRNVLEDPDGMIWISSSHGFLQLDTAGQFYSSNYNPLQKKILQHQLDVSTSLMDRDGSIWFSCWNVNEQKGRSLYRYDTRKNRLDSVWMPAAAGMQDDYFSIPNTMIQDASGNIWMSTLGGHIYVFNSDMQLLQDYTSVSLNGNQHKLESISALFADRNGNIWISFEQGVFICRPSAASINFSLPIRSFNFSFQHGATQLFSSPSGSIFVNNRSKGLYKWDVQNRELQYIPQQLYPGKWANYLKLLYADKLGLYINPWFSDEVLRFNESRNQLEPFIPPGKLRLLDPEGISTDSFHVFTGKHAIHLFNNKGNFIDSIVAGPGHTQVTDWTVAEKSELLLIDTAAIIYRLDLQKRSLEMLVRLPFRGGSYNILKLGDKLLVGTLYEGLKLITKSGTVVRSFSTHDGLLSNTIYELSKDSLGKSWIKTPNGINYIDSANGLHIYTTMLHDKRYHTFQDACLVGQYGAAFLMRDKLLYYPYVELKEPEKIPFVFTQIQKGNEDNTYRFEFAALDYTQQESIQYRYRLKQSDKDWIYLGNLGSLVFDQLQPGSYQLEIQYRRLNENWQENTLEHLFVIHRPFWKSWWFYTVMAILVLAPIVYSIRKEWVSKKRMEQLRWQLSRDLHDDIGSTLSSIGIYSTLLESRVKDEKGKSIVQEIRQHTRDMVQNMSDIVWAIQPHNEEAEPLIRRFIKYAEPILTSGNICLDAEGAFSCVSVELSMLQKRNIFLILKEAMNNCLKHGKATVFKLTCSVSKNHFIVEVGDNGIGFDSNALSRKNGLINMAERIKELRGTIQVDTTPGAGCRIRLTIPLQQLPA